MYIILDDNFKFIGFSLKKEENYQSIEISEQEHDDFMSKQSEGYTLYFDKKNKKLEVIELGNFEFINESGKKEKNSMREEQHNNDLLIRLKKEKIQLKKDILDFEEFGEDTEYLKKQLKTKEAEISELEEKLKSYKIENKK